MTWSSFDRLTDRRRHRSCPNKSSTLGAVAICVATGSLTSCSCTPPDSQIPARRQAQARTRSNSAKLADRRGPQPAAFRDRPQQDEGRRVAINGMPGRQPGLRASWLARQVRGDLHGNGIGVAAVNPGMAWTSMTQALTPQVVPSWRYMYPVVRFFQRRADPAKAAQVCVRTACAASAADITGRYFTERGKQGKLPASVLDPHFQRRVLTKAQELELRAPTSIVK